MIWYMHVLFSISFVDRNPIILKLGVSLALLYWCVTALITTVFLSVLRIWDVFGYSWFFLKYHNKFIFNVICRHIWFCSMNSVKMRGVNIYGIDDHHCLNVFSFIICRNIVLISELSSIYIFHRTTYESYGNFCCLSNNICYCIMETRDERRFSTDILC
jgi:hypothetical protein